MLRAGWYEHRRRGSHVTLKHPAKPGARVTIAIHARETVFPKTLASILDQAGLTAEEFSELL